ncbi:hypothetical protein ABIE44_003173 [Marmoricola sp. OAE513]|uniref:hypothetical protein n=1 Tax=Marmoricola sp. OAE513 TaxID=2817894 RepID=UPI001AE61E08
MTDMSVLRRWPAFLVGASLALGLVALAPLSSDRADAAPCGRPTGCTKFELLSNASTYDWWPWGKDPKSNIARYEFRTQDGNKAPARWSRGGSWNQWVVGKAGHGTLQAIAPDVPGARTPFQSSTTWATGRKTGRWEIRFRTRSTGSAGQHYRVQVELVPSGPIEACEARSITVASWDPDQPTTAKVGITRPGIALGSNVTVKTPPLNASQAGWTNGSSPTTSGWHVWAVQVKPTHISWFLDGRIIRRESRKAAQFDEWLSMRLSLISETGRPTASAKSQLDWGRWFSLKRTTKNKKLVKQLRTAPALSRIGSSVNPGCH